MWHPRISFLATNFHRKEKTFWDLQRLKNISKLSAGQGTKIPHASEKLSLSSVTSEPKCHNKRIFMLQWKVPKDTTKIPRATAKTWQSQLKNNNMSMYGKNHHNIVK